MMSTPARKVREWDVCVMHSTSYKMGAGKSLYILLRWLLNYKPWNHCKIACVQCNIEFRHMSS